MNTSTQKLTVAANIQSGHTYQQHGNTTAQAFTVLYISKGYSRNTVAAYRRARVRFADGRIGKQYVYANQRYIEIEVL